jgi:hypothetical protein
LEQHADWRQLVAVLRRIRAGERDATLASGLDPIDTAVVQRALDALTGIVRVDVDVDAWRTGATSTPRHEQGQQLAALANATVAAARGDPDATNALQPLLQALAAHPDWATLAAALRRILAGERGPTLLDGLDHPAATDVVTLVLNQLT